MIRLIKIGDFTETNTNVLPIFDALPVAVSLGYPSFSISSINIIQYDCDFDVEKTTSLIPVSTYAEIYNEKIYTKKHTFSDTGIFKYEIQTTIGTFYSDYFEIS